MNLTVSQYFLAIQREYLIADFKRKIYRHSKDKKYYSKVMSYKKEKIEDISNRNKLKSIFNSDETLQSIKSELFDSNGIPMFFLNEVDLSNYFSEGSEFCYNGESYILGSQDDKNVVLINRKGESFTVDKCEICRII